MKTQNEKILRYLRAHKRGITQMDALERFGCMRLASRISDLRQMGFSIKTENIAVKNREGDTCYVARYTLLE